MALLTSDVLPGLSDPEALYASEMAAAEDDSMPARWREILDDYLRAG